MELVILTAIGYVVWRFVLRKSPGGGSQTAPPKGRPAQPPPSKGRPVQEQPSVAFSAEDRERWPAHVLKAVEGIYEVANAEEPTTLGKMRTIAKRLTRLATPIAEYLDPLMEPLWDAREGIETEDRDFDALDELQSAVSDLQGAEDEAADAEDEVDVDVIGNAQNFVDAWEKARHP